MGLFDPILKALGYKLGSGRSGAFFDVTELQNPPSWGYQSYLKAYGEVGWLFAAVNAIAENVSRIPWHLYELDSTGDRTEVDTHPLIDLLNNLNPYQSRYQFFYLSTLYKKLVGESFWQINFNGKGLPAEIWLAPPAYMNVIPSNTNYIAGYEFKRNGVTIPFKVEEIIHIMTPNPYNPYRGLSEAQALTVDLDSERFASRYTQKTFFNEAVPRFVVEYPAEGMPNVETRKELMQEWDERYKSWRNTGKTGHLWGGHIDKVVMSNQDMDFYNLRNFSRDLILATYKVPHSVLGITDHTARAGAEATNYSFAMYTIQPELCMLREALNKELVPMFGDNLYLDFENPIPEDTAAGVNNAVNLFKAGIITRNDALKMIDLEPLDDEALGNEYFVQPTPTFGNPQAGNTPPELNPTAAPKIFLLDQKKNLDKGGEGSGNFGHEGRPGEVGGSGEGGGFNPETAKPSHYAVPVDRATPKETASVDRWESSLTGKQKQACDDWREYGWKEIRSSQTSGISSPAMDQKIADFHSALESAPDYNKPVYRGMKGLSSENIQKLANAQDITLEADSSFSGSKYTAAGFSNLYDWQNNAPAKPVNSVLFEVQNKGQSVGKLIGSTEREVLIQKGTAYSVISRDVIQYEDTRARVLHLVLEPK